ncbi:hypothetical protein K469DRAFT_356468 [Zopfia rhizophila CBS 207.26]|uniref:Uncharacterized protein n=1 Tax=Zopfia rhizophila CBS 207.26 TaxID=1314779 RepID=A0A6A6DJA2_9PEZI|nr:hypothetical protein K469DRAFT_356468 [Zopfia rhizophila CBS 207.26]
MRPIGWWLRSRCMAPWLIFNRRKGWAILKLLVIASRSRLFRCLSMTRIWIPRSELWTWQEFSASMQKMSRVWIIA